MSLKMLLVAALLAPTAAVAATPDENPRAEKSTEYRIDVVAPAVKVGERGVAKVSITALGDYHWNKEYPAKATVKTPAAVKADKTNFSQLKGDFKTEHTVASVEIPFTASASGTQTLSVDTRFSVCSERVCLLKKAKTEIAVIVSE